MAPVAAGLANSDTRFHREKWPSSLTRGRLFHSADKQTEFDSRNQHANNEITSLTFIPNPF